MAGRLTSLVNFVIPKKRPNPQGVSYTGTFRPGATSSFLGLPQYNEHMTDLYSSRQSQDSRALLKTLFKQDPDVSAAVNAYLTVADVEPWWVVRDSTGAISREGHTLLNQLMLSLFTRLDYTKPQPFALIKSLRALCEELRYMILLRGGIAGELVLNKLLQPTEVRLVDLGTVFWTETSPGVYIPTQQPAGGGGYIELNIPTLIVQFFRRDPTDIYPYSPFVAAINTIAARQQVVNDLYRIMKLTGYPRLAVKVLESVIRQNAPADCKADEAKMKLFITQTLTDISNRISGIRPDQPFIHLDSAEPSMLNEKSPGMAVDITAVVETLNAQNQAALKVMATIIGRGSAGVNTASVEARIFALNAEQINGPIADLFSQIFTLALRLNGFDGYVEFGFEKVELRPQMELEPQMTMRQTRYLELLSFGLIDDDMFHLEFFNRIRPDAAPILSGTKFMAPTAKIDVSKTSPNSDPLGRSLAPEN